MSQFSVDDLDGNWPPQVDQQASHLFGCYIAANHLARRYRADR